MPVSVIVAAMRLDELPGEKAIRSDPLFPLNPSIFS
jgi:hypothetical protein